jgi:hypothetical protein
VWTWNAIGKASGAWGLQPQADEAQRGFLLNHLIADELPGAKGTTSNSDPVTGQAGWYDLRVRLLPANAPEMHKGDDPYADVHGSPLPANADAHVAVVADSTWPRHAATPLTPGQQAGLQSPEQVLQYHAGRMHRATTPDTRNTKEQRP